MLRWSGSDTVDGSDAVALQVTGYDLEAFRVCAENSRSLHCSDRRG
jgi:hypothetical protein